MLVGAMMLEQNDEWSLNRRYMQLEGLQTVSDTVPTRLEWTTFRGRLRAEVLSAFEACGRRVVHRRRGACHASADGGQSVFAALR